MPLKLGNSLLKKKGKSKLIKSLVKLDYRNIFGLTFIVGTIFIVLGWKLDSIVCGVVLPVLCMLAYSSLGFVEDKNDTNIEQFADSIYYLGFLLTLVALIVSLIALSKGEYALEGVGRRFGIALATTVLGLFLRIILTNFRDNFSDQKVVMEEQLAKSIKDFSYQVQIHAKTLRTTTELYNSSIELSINSMNKSIETLTSGLESVSTKGLDHVDSTFERMNEQLSLAVTNLLKKIELIHISEDILISPIQEPIKKLAELLDEYKDGFASVTAEQKIISSDNKLFSDNLNNLNQSVTKFNSSIQNISETFSSIKDLNINTEGLNNTIDITISTIDRLSSALDKISDIEPNIKGIINSFDDIDKESQKLTSTIKNHETVISNIDDISNSHLSMVKRHQTDIEEIMKKSRANLDLVNESLIKSVKFITDELGRGSGGGSK
jgi:conjugal transfer/entry exclusion protein